MRIPIMKNTPLWQIGRMVGELGLNFVPCENKDLLGYLADDKEYYDLQDKWTALTKKVGDMRLNIDIKEVPEL